MEPLRPEDDRYDDRFKHLETLLREVRDNAVDAAKQLDKRVTYLEDVRVRAIEDQMLAEKVRYNERAAQAEKESQSSITRRHLWLAAGTIVATLIVGFFTVLASTGAFG